MKVLLIGYSASGKSTLAKMISAKHKVPIISVSELVKQFMKENGKANVLSVKNNAQMYTFIADSLPKDFILDGVREFELYRFLKTIHNFNTYIVDVDEHERFHIMYMRDYTVDQIIEKDLIERQLGLSYLILRIKQPIISSYVKENALKDFELLEDLK